MTIKQIKTEIETKRQILEKFEDYDMENIWDDHEDIRSLKSLILFGIKGMAAYAYHSFILGKTDSEVSGFSQFCMLWEKRKVQMNCLSLF